MGSKSTSIVSTSTETLQQDQRVASDNGAVALAPGALAEGSSLSINQLPPELSNLLGQSVTAAQLFGVKALDQQSQTVAVERDRYDETRKTLMVGLLAAIGLALVLTMGDRRK